MGFCSEWALVLVAGAYVFFALGMQPIENSLVASLTPERWRSTSYGVKFVLNFGVGSLAVYGVTALHRDGSFLPVYASVAALVVLVCLAAIILFRRTQSAFTNADSNFESFLS
jgi:MFS transporter, FSR family, fosmidomycin resistance protein